MKYNLSLCTQGLRTQTCLPAGREEENNLCVPCVLSFDNTLKLTGE